MSQLNVIFTLDKTVADHLLQRDANGGLNPAVLGFREMGADWKLISECRVFNAQVAYQASVPSIAVFDALKAALEQMDHPLVVGVWENGVQQGYVRNVETGEIERDMSVDIVYPFDAALYAELLSDFIEYNAESVEIGRCRRSVAEARLVQVNTFSGYGSRDLADHG